MVKYISPVNILFVSKTSSIRLQDMSSRRLEDVFSVTIFCLPRLHQDVFKTSSRRLGRRKIITLKTCWRRLQDVSWRRLEDVLKTNKCFLGNWSISRCKSNKKPLSPQYRVATGKSLQAVTLATLLKRYPPQKIFPNNFSKFTEKKYPAQQSLSNSVKSLQVVSLTTLLKRDPRTGVSESVICRCTTK